MSRIYYWDSSVFIALLKKEPGRAEAVEQFLEEAENGEVVILSSFMTLTEVVCWEWNDSGPRSMKPDAKMKLKRFFQKDYFEWINFDRKIAEDSRDLIWKFGLGSKDAVHLASAIEAIKVHKIEIAAIHSYDSDFTNLNGKISGISCTIENPIPTQSIMLLDDERRKPQKRKRRGINL